MTGSHWMYAFFQIKFILFIFYHSECDNGTFGYDCEKECKTCQKTTCERFNGNCTYDCIEGYNGHQCLTEG